MDLFSPLLAVHVIAAAALFGGTLFLTGSCRRALKAGDEALRHAAGEARRVETLAKISSTLTLLTGIGLILVTGGFANVNPRFHAAMGLMVVAIVFSAAVMGPGVKRLSAAAGEVVDKAAAEAAIKKLAMGSGVLHTLWLILLVMMVWR